MIIEMIRADRGISNERAAQNLLCYLLTGQRRLPDPGQVIAQLCSTQPDGSVRQRVGHVFTSWQEDDDLSWFDLPTCLGQMKADDLLARDSRIVERSKRLHFCLSLSPADRRLDRIELQAVLDDALEGLGLKGHTYLAVEHTDTEHQHLHVYASTVDTQRRRLSRGHKDPHAVRALCRTLEDRYGLIATGRAKAAAAEQKKAQAAELKVRLQGQVTELRACRGWAELISMLAGQGLQLHHGRKSGLCITDPDGHTVRTGRLDQRLTFSRLKERWGEPPPSVTASPQAKPQAAAQPALEPQTQAGQDSPAQLQVSTRLKNAALREMLSRAEPGIIITGTATAQARAAREAARLQLQELAFESESVAAAYAFMLHSGTLLRATAIEHFAADGAEDAQPTQELPQPTEGRTQEPRAQLQVLSPADREPRSLHYLRCRGYRMSEGEGESVQAAKGTHRLHISPDGRTIGIVDDRDETAMRDALRALHHTHQHSTIRVSGSAEFQRRAAAIAAGMKIEVLVSDPQLARELAAHPPTPVPEPRVRPRPARRRRGLPPWQGGMRYGPAVILPMTAEQKQEIRERFRPAAAPPAPKPVQPGLDPRVQAYLNAQAAESRKQQERLLAGLTAPAPAAHTEPPALSSASQGKQEPQPQQHPRHRP